MVGECMAGGACLVAGGGCVWLVGDWLFGWVCMVAGGACVVARRNAWLPGGMHSCGGPT